MEDSIKQRRANAIAFSYGVEGNCGDFENRLAQAVADSDRAAGFILIKRHGLEIFQEEIERAERAGDLTELPRLRGIGRAIKDFLAEIDNPQKEMKL